VKENLSVNTVNLSNTTVHGMKLRTSDEARPGRVICDTSYIPTSGFGQEVVTCTSLHQTWNIGKKTNILLDEISQLFLCCITDNLLQCLSVFLYISHTISTLL